MKNSIFRTLTEEKDKTKKTTALRCACGGATHSIFFDCYDPEEFPLEIVVSVCMNKPPFLKRLWIGIKYILFGTPQKYGHYEEILLNLDSVKELKKFIDSSIEQGDSKIEFILGDTVVGERNQNP